MDDVAAGVNWPVGDGKMARRTRAHDWSATPLGPVESWPQSLRSMVDLLLGMPGPATVLWGPEHVQLYNDAYIAVAKDRHPMLLGRRAAENWPDAYEDVIAPLLANADAGRATRLTDLRVELLGPSGRLEDRAFDTDWSPIRDEAGEVAGALQTLTETTDRHQAQARLREKEERQGFLLELSDALRPLTDAAEIQATTTRTLGEHLGVDRAMYGEVHGEPGAETGIIRGQYVRPAGDGGPPPVPFPERFTFRPFGAHTMAARYRGEPLIVRDVTTDPDFGDAERAAWIAAGVRAAVVAPLAKGGRLVAELGIHSAAPRAWTDAEVALVEEMAERTWAAAERARAEAALAASEQEYRSLFETMGQGYCMLELVRDEAGRVIDQVYLQLNPALERLFGVTVSEARCRKASEIFPGLEAYWNDAFDRVARTGKPERIEHTLGDRWFVTFAYPRGGDRMVALYEEITDRKRAELALRASEERQQFLLKLSDALRPLADPAAVEGEACRLLAEHMDVDRAYYVEVDEAAGTAAIERDFVRGGAPSIRGEHRVADFAWSVAILRRGDCHVVPDTQTSDVVPPSDRPASAALQIIACMGAPLIKQDRLAGALCVTASQPRVWTDSEVGLLREVGERIWSAIERARAEKALRGSEEKYRGLFESIDEGFCIIELMYDEAGNACDVLHLEANPAHARHSGVANVVGTRMRDYIPAEEARAWLGFYDRVARTGRADRTESEMPAIGRWVEVFASRLGGAGSAKVAVVFNDISERKRAEVELRASRERQTFLLGLSDQLRTEPNPRAIAARAVTLLADHLRLDRAYVAQVDKDRDVAEVGPEFRRSDLTPVPGTFTLSDFPEAFPQVEATTLVLTDIAADPTLSDRDRAGFAALRMGALIVASARADVHNPVWALLVATEAPRPWTAAEVALVEDVAERTWAAVERARAEAALRESEEQLRAFGEASSDVLWIRNAETLQWQYLSPAFEAIYGMTVEEALAGESFGKWTDLIVDEDRERAVSDIRRVVSGERVTFEYRVHRPDGRLRWMRDTDFPIFGAGAAVERIGGVGQDVTELKRIEAALGYEEERLRTLMEGIPQLVWRASDEGLWTWSSPQWRDVTGQTQEDSHGRGWLDAVHPADRDKTLQAWEAARPHGMLNAEYRLRRASDGAYLWHHTRSVPVRGEGGHISEWLGTSTDVHALREMQERQKVLVAELQHRTRNLITVVSALSHQTLKNSSSLSDFNDHFADRLAALSRVQGLLSALSAGKRVTFDELLGSELKALGAAQDKLTLDGPAGVPLRSATVQTFSLALHELATNALKYGALAAPGGHLTVRWGVTQPVGESPRLQVDWRETGVVMTQVGERPRGGGYGRELIEHALPYQLDAETTYEMTSDGVHCTIDVPASTATAGLD